MSTLFRAAAAALALALLPAAAGAEPVLGRVEAIYVALSRDLLVEVAAHWQPEGRARVAEVRLRDDAGLPARRVFLRVDGESLEPGDIVAVSERAQMRNLPAPGRDRLARVEARRGTEMARHFFREPAGIVALRRAE